MKRLSGIVAAIVTPFNEDGSIDYGAGRALVDFLMAEGVHGLFVCGTTGEFPLLEEEERKRYAEEVIRRCSGRAAVCIQVGHVRTDVAARLASHAVQAGADGIGIVTPFYFTYSDDELLEYFRCVCQAVPGNFPVYLYNIPDRTGNAVRPGLVSRLREAVPSVLGLKDSSGSLKSIAEFLSLGQDRQLDVLQGADEQLLGGLALGCVGGVSGNANVFPALFVRLWKEFSAARLENARQTQIMVGEVASTFGYGRIPLIKEGLKALGIGNGQCRRPFGRPSPAEVARVRELVRRFGTR